MVPLFVMMILPFLNGAFDSANLDNTIKATDPAWGGLQLSLVWLWLMCWSAWGVDVCATFAPEYKDTARDTKLALRSAALFSLVVYILLPIGFVGGGTPELVSAYDYVGAMDKIVGSSTFTDFFVVCLVAAFIITMNTATADGGRALYGISRAGMTVRQLGRLNRWHVPGNAMTIDMVINILFVLVHREHLRRARRVEPRLRPGAHVCAFRFRPAARDRPNWPRPIQLSGIWTAIAGLLAAWCLVLTIVGFGWMQVAAGGYGDEKEKIIGVSVLVIGILLFLFRRVVQDRESIHWREETPTMPDAREAALLQEEMR